MLQKQFLRFLTLLFFCCAAVSAASAKSENSPVVSLSFEKSVFGFNETVPVRVTISNPGRREIKILRWLTPVDGIQNDLFALTINGRAVKYTGILVKRADPTEADYLTLQPGEEIVNTVDLADYYDLSQNGNYQISYRAVSSGFSEKQPLFRQKSDDIKSESVTIWIQGTAKKTRSQMQSDDYSTTGCNATQTSALPSAVNSANYYAANSYNYLNAGAVDARYTTWFGAFNTTRYSTVRTHFLNIKNLLVADNYRIACNDSACQPSYYAFVYKNDATHTIYVCNQFWLAATTGTDSKAGTLVHEISHFSDIANTNDFVYGQSGAAALAVSNPNNAVNNADNHEYFAEASPVGPTAAAAIIAGRVINSGGRGISKALVTINDSTGQERTALTNPYGYYRFADVSAGETYVINARHKNYEFAPQVVSLVENLTELNIVAVQ